MQCSYASPSTAERAPWPVLHAWGPRTRTRAYGAVTIPVLLDRLARYHGLVARLRLLLNNATKRGLRDADTALLAALLQQLELLLATAEEIRRHHTEMQRLAADLRPRAVRPR